MHSIGIDLAKLGEPVGKVLIVGVEAENVVFAVVLDVDVPHIGVVDIQAAFFHVRDAGDGMTADERVAVVMKNLVTANVIALVAPHFGAANRAQGFAVVLRAGHAAQLAKYDEKNQQIARAYNNAHDNPYRTFKHNHSYKQEYLLLRAFFFIFCPACFQAALIA